MSRLNSFLKNFFAFVKVCFLCGALVDRRGTVAGRGRRFLVRDFRDGLVRHVGFGERVISGLSCEVPCLMRRSCVTGGQMFRLCFRRVCRTVGVMGSGLSRVDVRRVCSARSGLRGSHTV